VKEKVKEYSIILFIGIVVLFIANLDF